MPNLSQMIDEELDKMDAERSALPPLPVDPGGVVDIPGPMSLPERTSKRRSMVRGAYDLLYKLGVPQFVGLTAEGVSRVDTAFRGAVLSASGGMSASDYPKFYDDAMSGKVRITGKEFNRLAFGASLADKMAGISIPLWSKALMNPDPYLAGYGSDVKVRKRLTAEGVAGFATDMIVSPFTALSLIPGGAVTRLATKVPGGLRAVKAANAVDRALTWPIRAPLKAALSSTSTAPVVSFLYHFADPVRAFVRHQERLLALQEGPAQLQLKAMKYGLGDGALGQVAAKHKDTLHHGTETAWDFADVVYRRPDHKSLDQIAIDHVTRKANTAPAGKALINSNHPEVVKVRNELVETLDELRENYIVPLFDDVHSMDYDVVFQKGKLHRIQNPRKNKNVLFGSFEPVRRHDRWRPKAIGEKTIRTRGQINLPFRLKRPKPSEGRIELWHALDQTGQAIMSKTVWEARHKGAKMIPNPALKAVRAATRASNKQSPRQLTAEVNRIGYEDPLATRPNQGALAKPAHELGPQGIPIRRGDEPLPSHISKEYWINTGFVSRYSPKVGWRKPGVNPELANDTRQEFHYTMSKINDITGNSRGRHMIEVNALGEEFFANLETMIESKARKGRIRTYFWNKTKELVDPMIGYNFPKFGNVTRMTNALVNNTITATIGLNLGTAIANTSALANLAAYKGTPAMFRGIFSMASGGAKGTVLRGIRAGSGVAAEFHRLMHDEVWQYTLDRGARSTFFKPFNAVENFVRGAAANVAVGEYMKKAGVQSYDELLNLLKGGGGKSSWIKQEDLFRFVRKEVYDTNFAYSVAGRSSLMMNPIAKLGFTLRSYMWKEADFIARQWSRDKTGVMRLFALHGWAIQNLDEWAGINAESWLGWGFSPPIGRGDEGVLGPQAQMLWESFLAQHAMAEGRQQEAEQHLRKMRGQIGEVFRLFGSDGPPGTVQAHLNAAAMMGFVPNLPIVAIARTAKLANELRTGVRSYAEGRAMKHVPWEEASKSWFFRTHSEYADQQLSEMGARAKARRSFVMGQRVDRVVRALRRQDDKSGEAVMEAATRAFDDIPLGYGTSFRRAILFRDQDAQSTMPTPEMFRQMLIQRVQQSVIDRPVLEMLESGWLMEVFSKPYIDRALFYLDQGAIRPLTEPEEG